MKDDDTWSPHVYHTSLTCITCVKPHLPHAQSHYMTAWLTSVASLRIHTFLNGKGSVFYQEMSESRRYGERGERNSLGKRASENLVRQRARFCDATWRQLGFIFFWTLSMGLRIEVIRCKRLFVASLTGSVSLDPFFCLNLRHKAVRL